MHPTETHPTRDTIEIDPATAPTVRWDQPPVFPMDTRPIQWQAPTTAPEPESSLEPELDRPSDDVETVEASDDNASAKTIRLMAPAMFAVLAGMAAQYMFGVLS